MQRELYVRTATLLAAAALIVALAAMPAAAQDPPPVTPQEPDVTDIDLEALLNTRVTSAARREQKLTDVAAAIHVVRGDDIRRTGALSIAEALRSVPGMHVARTRSGVWAVSARGFNDNLSNKMLVLIDGRSVYSPLHSGVFWDAQDTLLEDVERIEVIRGPGGSLWGANAINGVVNVITKRAEETQGAVLTVGGGTEERAFASARYGFQSGDDLFVRVYAKYFHRDEAVLGADHDDPAYDGWFQGRGGFRADWKAGPNDRLTIMGEAYEGQIQENVAEPTLTGPTPVRFFRTRADIHGGHVILRWDRDSTPTSGFSGQIFYDNAQRDQAAFGDDMQVGDLDLTWRVQPIEGHDATFGAGYRIYKSRFDSTFTFQIDPEDRTDDIVNAFVQDEIALFGGSVRLTIGSKFEHNDYSGFEAQPSGRALWNVAEGHTLWAAVSRAVRTPSIVDRDVRLTPLVVQFGPIRIAGSIFGSDDFETEALVAYEAGYRLAPVEDVSIDLVGFYNRYDNLRSGRAGALFVEFSPPPPHGVFPVNLENDLEATTWGGEAAFNIQAAEWCLIQASYTFLRMNLHPSTDEGRDPRHIAWLRLALDLPYDFAFDAMGRYVSEMELFDVDSYIEVDARIAWRDPSRSLEAAVVGQNLLRDSHEEFQAEASRSEMQRSVYASLTWRF